MPVFQTSHGAIGVSNWAYQLQGRGGAPLDAAALAATAHDLVVMDSSRNGTNAGAFTPAEIDAIKAKPGGGAVAVSYISIGEASDFRDYWNAAWTATGGATGALTAAAPDWLGPVNPDWPESRKVRYWDSEWQSVIFNASGTGDLDRIVGQGFDAAYLDIVDAYYFWAVEAKAAERAPGDPVNEADAAARMIDFVVAMTTHARQTNPDFFVILQNGAFILDALAEADPARKAALLDAVGAIAVEDVYLRAGGAGENNGFKPDTEVISVLQRDFLGNGKPVLAVDYADDYPLIGLFLERALADGFIPTVAPDRDLDRVSPPLVRPGAGTATADLVAGTSARDSIHAFAGNDWVFGFRGADRLFGDEGNDVLLGGRNGDKLYGGAGHDRLIGDAGRDVLSGGKGRDVFEWNSRTDSGTSAASRDTASDFRHGQDKLDVKTIDAHSGRAGNQAFKWIGAEDFSGTAGELHMRKAAKGFVVEGDQNGDGRADFSILVLGTGTLTKGDFIL